MDLGGGREASAPTTSILPPPPRSPGSTPDQYGHTNPPHPASTDLPARKRSKVGKMECEGTRKWEIKNEIYPHQINMVTPTPSPPTDPMQSRENLQRRKKKEYKGEKQQDEIWFFTPDQCVHTNPCTTNQPIHCTTLKKDRKKENWGPKVEFWWCKRAAKLDGNSLIDDYISRLTHPKLMHQK